MTEQNELVKKIISLVHLDMDAIHAYQQAIDKIDVAPIKEKITEFKSDHERHVQNLSTVIRNLGGQVPEFGKDLKGFFIEGFTALRSVTGTEGALKAMKTNEELTNKTYQEALSWDANPEVLNVIRQNREDERRHLEYIEHAIENKLWEKGRETAA